MAGIGRIAPIQLQVLGALPDRHFQRIQYGAQMVDFVVQFSVLLRHPRAIAQDQGNGDLARGKATDIINLTLGPAGASEGERLAILLQFVGRSRHVR